MKGKWEWILGWTALTLTLFSEINNCLATMISSHGDKCDVTPPLAVF